ncbi:MAG: hypothetical protein IKT46_02610 [Clostridia bacterium]|nr:hypothetical protein [Clostridia bacterium]
MKYCTKCGNKLSNETVACTQCGYNPNAPKPTGQNNYLLNELSQRIYVDSIIGIISGVLQLSSGIFCIAGIINIILAIKEMNYSKEIVKNPTGIVKRYKPVTIPIIVLVYNLIFGGIIGAAASIYQLAIIRAFVMENRKAFDAMQ